jgi:hypothetical protein
MPDLEDAPKPHDDDDEEGHVKPSTSSAPADAAPAGTESVTA